MKNWHSWNFPSSSVQTPPLSRPKNPGSVGDGFFGIKKDQNSPDNLIWSNYSDLARPHSKWWFSKGNPFISGKSRLVKYYNLARFKPENESLDPR